MIYCVVPRPLADELYPKLVEYYEGEENVQVIVDRREFDRRARGRRSVAPEDAARTDESMQGAGQRRVVRDRRRARVPGDLPPLARAAS
ncbi:MAG: hypothetical protein ACHP93_01595 [Solirubrobacterales bacterium]